MDDSDGQQPTQRKEGGADEYLKKAPWPQKGRKGNTNGPRKSMASIIQAATNGGDSIVSFYLAIASGQPFPMKRVKHLPMTPEQSAVDRGDATPEERKIAKRQPRFIVEMYPYYPTVEDIKEAINWLTERGFGKAPQTVQIEGSQTSGFKMILRHWPPGTDPEKPGQNSTNGHKNGNGPGH